MRMLTGKHRVTVIAVLFAALYMVGYITRINFAAIISEIEVATGISRKLLSLSLTGSFFTYGIGQVVSGIIVDRISPKKLITVGFGITVLMNFAIPFCGSPYGMLAIWCVNGFAQSMMWPPIVKMMSQLFDGEEYKKAALIVSWGSALGTMVVYLLSPVVLLALSWRWVFAICGGTGLLALVLWQFFPYKPKKEASVQAKEKGSFLVFLSPIMAGISVAIVLQGMLKDGVTTWMPSFIVETYHWSTVASILTAVILPIFSILCFHTATKLYRTVFTNPLLCAGVFFGIGVASAIGLYAVTGSNAGLSVFFSALLTGCMHGVNMMLISMLPPYFKRFGLTGTASGVLNACSYVGSALSTYGIAAVSEMVGWKSTVLLWGVIALLGTAICFLWAGKFKKRFM